MIKCVVLDFDGVLVQSNAIKRNAYFEIFEDILLGKNLIEKGIANSPAGDRYEVIRSILDVAIQANRIPTPAKVEELIERYAQRYNGLCEEAVVKCPEVRGVSDVLPELAAARPLYINSDTPEEPLRRIVHKRGWTQAFRQILGRPRTKEENLKTVLNSENLPPDHVIFCGDRQSDLKAATAVRMRFIAMRSDGNDFIGRVESIKDFHELKRVVLNQGGLSC
jgi:phosphoglycolate phosphatase-like HAD superfamily hydrolase